MKNASVVTCPFCSLGCQFKILQGEEEVIFSSRTRDEIEFHSDAPVNAGSLCPRGHFASELLSHPYRLGQAYFRRNGKMISELPERIFQKIARNISGKKNGPSLAILFDPALSLHDLSSLHDFAAKLKVSILDFVAPADQHFFRGLTESPFQYRQPKNIKQIRNLRNIICLGDVFTKHPVLSQHLLEAKYAFRGNRFLSMNPFICRTVWFTNLHIAHQPHLEPLLLLYLLHLVLQTGKQNEKVRWLGERIASQYLKEVDRFLSPNQKARLETFAGILTDEQDAALIFSTHLYNAAGGYLSAVLLSALSELTGKFFIPLFSAGNLYYFLKNRENQTGARAVGQMPALYQLQKEAPDYIIAAGFNPQRLIPGNLNWPKDSEWLLFSMVQTELPSRTFSILPITHFYEQLDWRVNLFGTSLNSDRVKKPLGAAQPLSQFLFLFSQAIPSSESSTSTAEPTGVDWQNNFAAEWEFYLGKLESLWQQKGFWLLPQDHVAHHADANLTRYSSWAAKDCRDHQVVLAESLAGRLGLPNGKRITISGIDSAEFQVKIENNQIEDALIVYSHYSPVRKSLPGGFGEHNRHYYFWCPRVTI